MTSHAQVAATELFRRYHPRLRRNVGTIVHTSDENIEDACMFAWTKFLSQELQHIDAAYSWLMTVAIREALKLDRRTRRTCPLVRENDELVDVADPKDQLHLTRLLADAGDVISAAGLSERQRRILGLQVLGLTYDEIRAHTGDTNRTIERQIRGARHKLDQALTELGG